MLAIQRAGKSCNRKGRDMCLGCSEQMALVSKDQIPFRRKAAILIISAAAMTASKFSRAADITWTNPAGGSFSDGANWTGGSPPGTADNADFELPGTTPYAVSFNANIQTSELNVNGSPVTLNLGGNQYTVMQSGGSPFTTATDITSSISLNGGTLISGQTTLVSGTGAVVSVNGSNTGWTTDDATTQNGAEIDVT